MNSPQFRAPLWLAAVALAVLAVSLVLAFASAPAPRPDANADAARRTTAETRLSTRAPETTAQTPSAAPASPVDRPPLLWALLAPWAFAADAIAVLGLAAVLIVRYNARRRRGARR